jgi:hypothetical protein
MITEDTKLVIEVKDVKEVIATVIEERLQPLLKLVQILERYNLALESALNIYAQDPHQFSSRPCATCSNISELLKKEWGCLLVREKK